MSFGDLVQSKLGLLAGLRAQLGTVVDYDVAECRIGTQGIMQFGTVVMLGTGGHCAKSAQESYYGVIAP